MFFKKKNNQAKPSVIAALYHEHRDRLYWIAYEILKDKDSSEDAVQTTFERVIKNLPQLDMETPEKISALLKVICRNVSIDVLRKQSREKLTPLYENDENFSEDTYNPEKIVISKESYNIVMNIVENMDIKYKSILLLNCGHGLNIETAAKLLGISFENAKKRLFRARKLVKEKMMEIEAKERTSSDEIL